MAEEKVVILLFGHKVSMSKEDAVAELWARGLDYGHVVSGLSKTEYKRGIKEWEDKLMAHIECAEKE